MDRLVCTGDPDIQTIDWNGIRPDAVKTPYGSVTVEIPGFENRTISLPRLSIRSPRILCPKSFLHTMIRNGLFAIKLLRSSLVAPLTLPVLFSNDYGYYTRAKIHRGYLEDTNSTAVNITCSGGLEFGLECVAQWSFNWRRCTEPLFDNDNRRCLPPIFNFKHYGQSPNSCSRLSQPRRKLHR
jgi:hypothetical protein